MSVFILRSWKICAEVGTCHCCYRVCWRVIHTRKLANYVTKLAKKYNISSKIQENIASFVNRWRLLFWLQEYRCASPLSEYTCLCLNQNIDIIQYHLNFLWRVFMLRHTKPVIIFATAMLVSSLQSGIGKYNKMSHYFLFSSYHNNKLQLSDKNIKTYTQLKF